MIWIEMKKLLLGLALLLASPVVSAAYSYGGSHSGTNHYSTFQIPLRHIFEQNTVWGATYCGGGTPKADCWVTRIEWIDVDEQWDVYMTKKGQTFDWKAGHITVSGSDTSTADLPRNRGWCKTAAASAIRSMAALPTSGRRAASSGARARSP
jgi:hypothetical protein